MKYKSSSAILHALAQAEQACYAASEGIKRMKHFEVVAAVCVDGDRIFCAQRKDSGETAKKWEFPGGKIEPGETREEALIREFQEEFQTSIIPERYLTTVHHQYQTFAITMHAYLARITGPAPTLTEHLAVRWLPLQELPTLDWAPVDIPIVQMVMEVLGKEGGAAFSLQNAAANQAFAEGA